MNDVERAERNADRCSIVWKLSLGSTFVCVAAAKFSPSPTVQAVTGGLGLVSYFAMIGGMVAQGAYNRSFHEALDARTREEMRRDHSQAAPSG